MKSNTFYKKILKLFLIIGIVPTLLIGIVTALSTNKVIERRLISEAQKSTEACLSNIEVVLNNYLNTIKALCESNTVMDFFQTDTISDSSEKQFYEAAYPAVADLYEKITADNGERSITTHKSVTDLHLVNVQTGKILSMYDTPAVYDLTRNSDWGVYRKAKSAAHAIVYFSHYTNNSNADLAATAIKSFYKDGKLLGYLALDIPLDILKQQINQTDDLMPMHFSLVTDQNYIIWNDSNIESTHNFISDLKLPHGSGYYIDTEQKERQLVSYYYSRDFSLFIIGSFNLYLLLGNLRLVIYIWVAALLLITLLCVITAIKVTRTITIPLQQLTASMKIVEKGDYDVAVESERNDEFGYVADQFNHMCRTIKETTEINLEKQELLRIAELKQLQSQINPHFLYNTLDSIKYLAKMNGEEEIFIMTKSLNALLKNGLNISKEFTTLSESLKNLFSYIAIQKIRFPDKFDVDTDVDETLMPCIIPNLILQPIVENAMLHGLEPLQSQGHLAISAYQASNVLFITVSDNGVGMDDEDLHVLTGSLGEKKAFSHIGLKNVHQRLRLYYGVEYGITIESTKDSGTSVTLKLPCQKEVIL